jgi:predicted regulator of Ras-like GTPase activity (Roadblock/LC7/MglB family)
VKNFSIVAKFPEVIGAALSDASGTLLDSAGQVDGEMAGAVHAFTARALEKAGEVLGLSTLDRVTLVGGKSACVIIVHDGNVLGAVVDPSKPLAAIEMKIWDAVTK